MAYDGRDVSSTDPAKKTYKQNSYHTKFIQCKNKLGDFIILYIGLLTKWLIAVQVTVCTVGTVSYCDIGHINSKLLYLPRVITLQHELVL